MSADCRRRYIGQNIFSGRLWAEYIPRLVAGMDILVNISIFTLCTLLANYGQFHFFLMIASLTVSHTCHTSDAQHLSLSGSCQRILILEIPMCPSSPSKSITQPCSSPTPISATPPQFINNKYVAHFQVSIDCYKLFLDIH